MPKFDLPLPAKPTSSRNALSIHHKQGGVFSLSSTGMKRWWLAGFCLAFSFILVEQSQIQLPLRSMAYSSSSPGRKIAAVIQNFRSWSVEKLTFIQEGGRRLAQLEYAYRKAVVDQHELTLLRQENERLLEELQLRQPQQLQLVEWFGTHRSWFINQGCQDGVQVGATVYADRNFLGTVTEVEREYSTVRIWDDPSWRIPVKVGTASAQGLFQVSRGKPEITEVLPNAMVQRGDLVVTVGGAGIPPQVPLATVTEVADSSDFGTRELIVEPLASPSESRWVYVEKQQEQVCQITN